MKLFLTAALIAALTLAGCGDSGPSRTPSGQNAKVFFIEPSDGAEVSSPVTVKFGIEGMDVVPAGTEKVHSGHHHVLIDTKLENFDMAIPADDNHKHFGGGQTETQLELSPGKHTLQLVLGDHNHIPHDPVVQSDVITITVK